MSSPVPAGLAAPQVEDAILAAATRRRWVVLESTPEHVLARIDVRGKHMAQVDVPYDARGYGIRYRDRSGLMHGDAVIHRNDNKWVTLLDQEIRQELGRAAYPPAAR